MKKTKREPIRLTLPGEVIQTILRHRTIILITVLISMLCSGLFEGLMNLLKPYSAILFPTADSVPYPQYIGTWAGVYAVIDILTALDTVGFSLIPLAFIFKAEHPDAAPIGIDLLSSTKNILLLLLLSLLTTLPKHLINCGYDIIEYIFEEDIPIFFTILTALLLFAESVVTIVLGLWIIPKKTAVIASDQMYASYQKPQLLQLILTLTILYAVSMIVIKPFEEAAFPFSLIRSLCSCMTALTEVLIWYRSFLPMEV